MRVAVGPAETREVDFGFVGEIDRVDRLALDRIQDAGLCPVICSLCANEQGTILNINADTLAAELAKALSADRLISVSDVDGIYRDPGDPSTLVRRLTVEQARECMADGTFTEGMIPKVKAALDVIDKGVASFQIVSGLRPNALTEGVEADAGTLITR
jgi:acetylglutamate kinase